MNANVWSPSHVPNPPPKPWPFVVGLSYVQPLQTPRRISGWRPTCPVTARRSASGVPGIVRTGSPVYRMRRAQVGRGAFPPSERIDVLSIATSTPADYHCPATRWSLDDMTATLRDHVRARAMSRSTLWRILDDADLKPHRSVYWLNSHDPAFEAKARDICHLYVNALRFYQHGRLVICVDEKTGMQILQRKHPTQLAQPGQPEKREQEYIRHGVRVLIASFVVPTGQVLWHLGPPAPVRTLPHIWPTCSDNSRPCNTMTGWSIISIRTGAWNSAASWRPGVISPSSLKPCGEACSGERS